MDGDLLFVYGTLRRASGTAVQRTLADEADFVSSATFCGKMFLIDGYPGVIASENPEDIVHGDLYRLRRPERSLAWIDRYEQCGGRFPSPEEYQRQIRQITLPDATACEAWIYLYNHPVDGRERVMSGDFLDAAEDG
jgi:gamma-glutamylcyclotransferase (GGCT)/AIG2-like uncharacterized protein YtfP